MSTCPYFHEKATFCQGHSCDRLRFRASRSRYFHSKDRKLYRATPDVSRALASSGLPAVPCQDRTAFPARRIQPRSISRSPPTVSCKGRAVGLHGSRHTPAAGGPASRRSVATCPLTLPAARGPALRAAAGAAGSSGSPWGQG